MTAYELLEKRKKELQDAKAKLEKNLEPLAAVEAELSAIEQMQAAVTKPEVDHTDTLNKLQELIK